MLEDFRKIFEITVLDINIGRLVLFFVVILFFQILKKLFVKIVIGFFQRFTKKTKNKLDDAIFKIIEKPLRFMFTVIGFYIAFQILNLPESVNQTINLIIKSLFIYCVFWALYRSEENINKLLINKFSSESEIVSSFLPLFNKTIRIGIFIIGATVIIQLWGYNIGAIITGLGIGGLAVALAAKDTLANFFGSIMIIIDRPFKVGDWIICDGIEGVVEDIGFRTTKIRTFAKALVSVPNANITTSSTVNWSLRDRRRIKYSLGVTYSATREQMEKTVKNIRQMLENHDRIHNEGLMVYFDEFADSSMNIFLYCFTKTAVWDEYLSIKQDINLKIMKIFEDAGVEFAFPSMSVYLEKTEKENL